MNYDQVTIDRTGYTIFDVLSDIGGIQSVLMSGLGIFLGIWNYNNLDNYMASRLYKAQRTSSDGSSPVTEIRPTRYLNICEWLYDHVPDCMRC